MPKATLKIKGGKLVKVWLKESEGKIQEIKISGDFFLHPEELIEELEEVLIGKRLREKVLIKSIKKLVRDRNATIIGMSPEDLAKCILMAGDICG